MRRPEVPVENMAEILWGGLLVIYLIGSGRPEFLDVWTLSVFGLSGAAALLELYLRRMSWRWLTFYDIAVWTTLLSAMVAVTGGRGSELWYAYLLMSLTAPSIDSLAVPYYLIGVNCLLYAGIFTLINPYGAPFNLSLLILRIGMIFLVAWVVDQSMRRERASQEKAVQIAQSRVGELVSARDAERKRVAGDIHDWLGTGIIAPMRKLELAQRAPDQAAVAERIGEALDIMRRSHEELRRVMENLYPHLLEQMGLTDALRAYVHQWGAEQNANAEFKVEPGPEPHSDLALAIYRILQEALNNAAKHARGASVDVRLILEPDRVGLYVSDDGPGFTGGRTGGRGLTGMQERAAVLGGRVAVRSKPGQGTTVAAELPTRAH